MDDRQKSSGNTKEINIIETNKRLETEIKRQRLNSVYDSLKSQGYNPVKQLVGYILTGDPTYITQFGGARDKMRSFDRYELIETILNSYFIDKTQGQKEE